MTATPPPHREDGMDELRVGRVALELTTGDIAAQHGVDAVVNAANAELRTGGGVAGALHRAAGPGLAEECRPLAPIRPGQAVITMGHRLPNPHVIHCLGPVYGQDEPAAELLASCYRAALRLAGAHGLRSIAFPAISTGAFGYPAAAAARIALRTVVAEAPRVASLERVRFVLYDDRALAVHRGALAEAAEAAAAAGGATPPEGG
jgi:O-acetyl-ADP-ribose deacetylase